MKADQDLHERGADEAAKIRHDSAHFGESQKIIINFFLLNSNLFLYEFL